MSVMAIYRQQPHEGCAAAPSFLVAWHRSGDTLPTVSSTQPVYAPQKERSFAVRYETQFAFLALGICLIALPVLRHSFVHTNSFTFDELTHIQAGYRYWQCGEFANNPEHPPLVKLIAAAPIRHWQLAGYPGRCGDQVIRSRG